MKIKGKNEKKSTRIIYPNYLNFNFLLNKCNKIDIPAMYIIENGVYIMSPCIRFIYIIFRNHRTVPSSDDN
jgi:hypothetical protein